MKILLVRLSSFGDVVFTLPLAKALRGEGDRLAWAVEGPLAELVEGAPYVDDILVATTRAWRRRPFSEGTRAELRTFLSCAARLRARRRRRRAGAPEVRLDHARRPRPAKGRLRFPDGDREGERARHRRAGRRPCGNARRRPGPRPGRARSRQDRLPEDSRRLAPRRTAGAGSGRLARRSSRPPLRAPPALLLARDEGMGRRRDGGLLPRPRGEGARPGPSLGTGRAGARRADRRGFGRDGLSGASEPARGLGPPRFPRRALRRRRHGPHPPRRRRGNPDGGALRSDRPGAIRPRRAASPGPAGRDRGLQCRSARPSRPDC